MTSELRKTGISVVGDVPWGTHFCTFYETKQDLLDVLVPFFKTGLENNEFCLWIISDSVLMTIEEAASALRKDLPDLNRYVSEGAMEFVERDKWFLNGNGFDLEKVAKRFQEKVDSALARGYAGIRVNGSPAWLHPKDEKRLVAFEQTVDKLYPNTRIIASCTYPISDSDAAELLDVADAHQFVLVRRRGTWEMFETPKLLQARSELKRLNEELEQKVVERTRELAAANEALRQEIDERKRAEEAVRLSEDRTRLIVDTIPVMAWTLRPDGVVDFLSQRWVDYAGVSLEQYVADPAEPIHPEDRERVFGKCGVQMARGEGYEDEMRLRRADGEYRWFLVRTEPLRGENGNIIKWYGVSIDIEDRKRAEEQLRREEEHSRKVLDTIPALIGSGPPDGTLDYCNQQWLAFSGLTLEQLGAYEELLHPDDKERVFKAWQETVAIGKPYEMEQRHRRFDGVYRWFLTRGVPLRDKEGRIERWYGTLTDIDDRKRAEDVLVHQAGLRADVSEAFSKATHLREILRGCTEAIVRHLDAAFARIWMLNKEEGMLELQASAGMYTRLDGSYSRIPVGDLKVGWIARKKRAHLTNDVMNDPRVDNKDWAKDNGMVAFAGYPLIVEDQLIGVVALFARHPVSESIVDMLGSVADMIAQGIQRKRAEEQLKRSNRELRALSARLHSVREEESARIAREIHDELGGSLTSLRWDLEEAGEVIAEATAVEQVAALSKKIEAMMALTEATLDTVRRLSSELRPVALDELGLVEAIEWQARQFENRTGIAVHYESSVEKIDLNNTQSTAVFRIFQEAMTNILRHARATKVTIRLKQDAGEFSLTIKDNGKGFTENEKSDAQSLGILGMRERAYLMGGEIKVESALGRGTKITLRVPLVS